MELFGFRLDRSKKEKTQDKALKSFVVPTFDDGAIPVEAGGFMVSMLIWTEPSEMTLN